MPLPKIGAVIFFSFVEICKYVSGQIRENNIHMVSV